MEREHYGKCCATNSLVGSVERAWNREDDGGMLLNFSRLKIVLCQIIGSNGANDHIELSQGNENINVKIKDLLHFENKCAEEEEKTCSFDGVNNWEALGIMDNTLVGVEGGVTDSSRLGSTVGSSLGETECFEDAKQLFVGYF